MKCSPQGQPGVLRDMLDYLEALERDGADAVRLWDGIAKPLAIEFLNIAEGFNKKRHGFGLSGSGNFPRQIAIKMMDLPTDPISPRTKLLFQVGFLVEAQRVAVIKCALAWKDEGKSLTHTCLDPGGQMRVFFCPACLHVGNGSLEGCPKCGEDLIGGHPDGLLEIPPSLEHPVRRGVVDVKTMNGMGFDRAKKAGGIDNLFGGLHQLEAYRRCLEPDYNTTFSLRLCEKKDTSDLMELLEWPDDEVWDATVRNIQTARRAKIDGELPPICNISDRPHTTPRKGLIGWYETKKDTRLGLLCSYCDMKNNCFEYEFHVDDAGKPVYLKAEKKEAAG